VCERGLATVVNMRFLYLRADGTSARITGGAAVPGPHPATATVAGDTGSLKVS
jgi:hypothetical protein